MEGVLGTHSPHIGAFYGGSIHDVQSRNTEDASWASAKDVPLFY